MAEGLCGGRGPPKAVVIVSYLTHMVPGSHGSDGPLGGDGGSDGWCVTAEEATTWSETQGPCLCLFSVG